MNAVNHEEVRIGSGDLLCYICQDFFCKPQTACCGHTFCYMCIDQYFLYSDICPRCLKSIRGKPLNPIPSLSQFIENVNKGYKEEEERFKKRKEETKNYIQRRELRGIKVGMVLDIRDSNNIWCQGMITRIITRLDEPIRFLRVNYLNYLEKKEEDVPIDSDRLASKGFFASRKDIPHYGSKSISPIITKYQF